MRMFRLIAGFIALALVASLSGGMTSSANAVDAKAKQRHAVVKLKADEIRNSGRFYVAGKVLTAKNKRVFLQKKNCKKCAYRPFKSDKTTRKGQFRINFDGPNNSCYRFIVPATPRYKKFQRVVGCITVV